MWEVGRSGDDPGMIHRSKGVRCSGVSGIGRSVRGLGGEDQD